MFKLKNNLLWLSCVMSCLVCQVMLGYEYNGYRYPKNNFPTFYVNQLGTPDCSGEFTAIQSALQTWNAVNTTYIDLRYGGTTTTNIRSYDGTNLMIWVENGWRDIFPGSSAIAVNTTWYNSYTGEAYESDILFNGEDYLWSDNGASGRYDVQNIATHEIGHSVGLSDLYGGGDTEKTMYGYSNTGETKKSSLSSDDEIGARYVNFDPQTSGTLTESQVWAPNLNSNTISLTSALNTSSYSLTLNSGITLNLNGYPVISSMGTIADNGATITSLASKVKNSSGNLTGLFPTVQGALNNAASGYTVEIQPGTFSENISVPSGVTVNGSGAASTTINGTVTFSNASYSSLSFATINSTININFSNNITVDNTTAGSSDSYFDVSSSSGINITSLTSSYAGTWAIFSHAGSDFVSMGGTLNNKTGEAIHLRENSYADIYQAYFCTNPYPSYDIVSFSSTANAYGCTFTSSTPGGSVYGNVYWDFWSSCGGGGGFFGKAPGTDETSSLGITTDDPSENEFAALMRSYRNVNEKVRKDKNEDKHSAAKKYNIEYKDLVEKCKLFIKKYPDSRYAASLLYRITGVLLSLDDFDELSLYLQSTADDSKLQNLKPYALTALISKQIKTGNYKNAADSYENLLRTYPSHSMAVEWLYSEGCAYKYLLKDEQKANDIFALIIRNFPDSPTARSAKNQMGITKAKSLAEKEAQTGELPKEFSADNYPNPFNPSTTINYTLPADGIVTIRIYDILGREVKTLIDGYSNAGNKTVVWDGRNVNGQQVTSGVYFYTVSFKGQVLVKKMLMMK